MSNEIKVAAASVAAVPASATVRPRLDSIDLLRGLIMVLMALDHVRDFFSRDIILPDNLSGTPPALFFTRWITHFCAPAFVFLAGTSAFLYGTLGRSKQQLSRFLWTRGLWLVVLEMTIVAWAWHFDVTYPRIAFMVIWALGISMIALAGLVRLPMRWIIGLGAAMVAGHNLLDPIYLSPIGLAFRALGASARCSKTNGAHQPHHALFPLPNHPVDRRDGLRLRFRANFSAASGCAATLVDPPGSGPDSGLCLAASVQPLW